MAHRKCVWAQISVTTNIRILKLRIMFTYVPGIMPIISEFRNNPRWPTDAHFSIWPIISVSGIRSQKPPIVGFWNSGSCLPMSQGWYLSFWNLKNTRWPTCGHNKCVRAQISETISTRILKLRIMFIYVPGMMPVISKFWKNPRWPTGGLFSK